MNDTMTERGITINLTSLVLTTGTTSTFSVGADSDHVCNGKFQTAYTDADNVATPTTDYNTGVAFLPITGVSGVSGQGTVIVWGLLEGGDATATSIKCMQGSVESLELASTTFVRAPQFPSIPNNITPFAYQVLKQTSQESQAALFGTTAWDAGTYYTNAIVNIAQMPLQPQVS